MTYNRNEGVEVVGIGLIADQANDFYQGG